MKTFTLNVMKLDENAKLPEKRDGDAAYDFFCLEDIKLFPMERKLISTGISIEIPYGIRGQLYPRSGLAVNQGIHVMAGKIDPSYRGEIKILLINLSNTQVEFEAGSKIAQMEFNRYEECQVQTSLNLSDTERNDGGFGSTGS